MEGKHVVELVKERVTNPHHHRYLCIVHGTLALVDMKKSITADGIARWEVDIQPEERCPLKPFIIEVKQPVHRAVAAEAADALMRRMRGEEVEPPRRNEDLALVYG